MGFFDAITGGIETVWDTVTDIGGDIISAIGSEITDAISSLIGKGLFYLIDNALLSLVNAMYRLFSVFAGISKISYTANNVETKDYLVNVFFTNNTISNIYWAMAVVGICMAIVFAIIGVVKKMFDLNDKQQRPLSAVLTALFKSIFLILIMSVGVTTIMNATNLLMRTVNDAFNNADLYGKPAVITYTNQQYATMARALNTIGNYSLNPSYNSRYNINSCFNEVRSDLYSLQQEGIFDAFYLTEDKDGNEVDTWQSVLQKVVNSADLTKDVEIDSYNANMVKAMTSAMETVKTNTSIRPLEQYEANYYTQPNVSIDTILFLIGTTNAAHNEEYNRNASFTDAVRGAYYSGEKNFYSLGTVMEDFSIMLGAMNYLLVAFLGYLTLKNLWRCIVQCVVRLFTLVSLYIVAPPFIAIMPLDDGEKFKQWMTAFIVQCFGIFGNVIPMRLLLIFIPIILNSDLVLFPNNMVLNMIGKVLLVVGGLESADRFGGIITGILTNNAGMEALRAGSTNEKADAMFNKGVSATASAAKFVGGTALGVAGGVAGFAADVTGLGYVGRKIGKGISTVAGAISGVAGGAMNAMREHGGIVGAAIHAARGGSFDLPQNFSKLTGFKDDGQSG